MNKCPAFTLLNVGFNELNANWNWSKICSPFARIYLVTDGHAKTRIDGKLYDLHQGHIYLIPPFTLHDDICDSRFSLYYIHFYENSFFEESLFDKYEFPMALEANDLHEMLVKRLFELNPERYLKYIDPKIYDNASSFHRFDADNKKLPFSSFVETQGILCQLMAAFIEKMILKSANQDSRIYKAIQYIHENINQDVSVSELAQLSCLTTDHFIRLFKKETHSTPLKYINQKKMERAQILLTTGSQSIQQIAVDLSIDNISYFNRLFRLHTGKTPSQFRNDTMNI